MVSIINLPSQENTLCWALVILAQVAEHLCQNLIILVKFLTKYYKGMWLQVPYSIELRANLNIRLCLEITFACVNWFACLNISFVFKALIPLCIKVEEWKESSTALGFHVQEWTRCCACDQWLYQHREGTIHEQTIFQVTWALHNLGFGDLQ